ncbi:MAG: hypothetical protein HQL76_15215 [Magnetococcales bacterium]|nr:hypothetical protein [Magnetococcales bacterium]
MKTRMMAALGYMGVLCLVPLLLNRQDGFVAFHARQGLILWIWAASSFFLMHFPGLGPYIFSTSMVLVTFASLVGLVSVLLNRSWKFPIIHGLVLQLFGEKNGDAARGQ